MIYAAWDVDNDIKKGRRIVKSVGLDEICEYFKQNSGRFVNLFEFGIGHVRFDLIRVDCHNQRIKGFEFKASRQDFTSDKKWTGYLKYCHTLTFVCPRGTIDKKDLPSEVGIMEVFKYTSPTRLEIYKGDSWQIGGIWVRRPRSRKLDDKTYIKVITLLLNRAKWRKGEIF